MGDIANSNVLGATFFDKAMVSNPTICSLCGLRGFKCFFIEIIPLHSDRTSIEHLSISSIFGIFCGFIKTILSIYNQREMQEVGLSSLDLFCYSCLGIGGKL